MFKSLTTSIIIFLLIISINSITEIYPLGGISEIEIKSEDHEFSFTISCNSTSDLSSDLSPITLNLNGNEGGYGEASCTLEKATKNLKCRVDTDNYISLQNSTDFYVYNVQQPSGYELKNFTKISSIYYLNENYKEIQCLNYKLNLNIYIGRNDVVPAIMEFKLKYKIENHKDEADCFFPTSGNEILCVMDASNFTFLKGKTITFEDNKNIKLNKGSTISFDNLDKIVMEDTCGKDSYGKMININILNLMILIIFSFINL